MVVSHDLQPRTTSDKEKEPSAHYFVRKKMLRNVGQKRVEKVIGRV